MNTFLCNISCCYGKFGSTLNFPHLKIFHVSLSRFTFVSRFKISRLAKNFHRTSIIVLTINNIIPFISCYNVYAKVNKLRMHIISWYFYSWFNSLFLNSIPMRNGSHGKFILNNFSYFIFRDTSTSYMSAYNCLDDQLFFLYLT